MARLAMDDNFLQELRPLVRSLVGRLVTEVGFKEIKKKRFKEMSHSHRPSILTLAGDRTLHLDGWMGCCVISVSMGWGSLKHMFVSTMLKHSSNIQMIIAFVIYLTKA